MEKDGWEMTGYEEPERNAARDISAEQKEIFKAKAYYYGLEIHQQREMWDAAVSSVRWALIHASNKAIDAETPDNFANRDRIAVFGIHQDLIMETKI